MVFEHIALLGNKVFRCEEVPYAMKEKEVYVPGNTTGYTSEGKHYFLTYFDDVTNTTPIVTSSIDPKDPSGSMIKMEEGLYVGPLNGMKLRAFTKGRLGDIVYSSWFTDVAEIYAALNGINELNKVLGLMYNTNASPTDFLALLVRDYSQNFCITKTHRGIFIENETFSFGFCYESTDQVYLVVVGQPYRGPVVQAAKDRFFVQTCKFSSMKRLLFGDGPNNMIVHNESWQS